MLSKAHQKTVAKIIKENISPEFFPYLEGGKRIRSMIMLSYGCLPEDVLFLELYHASRRSNGRAPKCAKMTEEIRRKLLMLAFKYCTTGRFSPDSLLNDQPLGDFTSLSPTKILEKINDPLYTSIFGDGLIGKHFSTVFYLVEREIPGVDRVSVLKDNLAMLISLFSQRQSLYNPTVQELVNIAIRKTETLVR
jgi:hypothetical protein